jgi:hypothetical protein
MSIRFSHDIHGSVTQNWHWDVEQQQSVVRRFLEDIVAIKIWTHETALSQSP